MALVDGLYDFMQPRVVNILRDIVKDIDTSPSKPFLFDKGPRYEVQLDMPGLTKADIEIELTNEGVLAMSGVRKLSETKRRKYNGSVLLPPDANLESITAQMEHGVLTITIDKIRVTPPEQSSRKIPIG